MLKKSTLWWQKIPLLFFIILAEMVFQYFAARYYLFNNTENIAQHWVLRGTVGSAFWISGLLVARTFFRRARRIAVTVWAIAFLLWLFAWIVNVNILYYSGLYVSPAAVEHARGAGGVLLSRGGMLSFFVFGVLGIFFLVMLRLFLRRAPEDVVPRSRWRVGVAVFAVSCALFVVLQTPEWMIAQSFYEYYVQPSSVAQLDPMIQKKLERFGLFYTPESFYVSEHSSVYREDAAQNLLPTSLQQNPPNILIVFLESFSNRLTSIANDAYPDLTPGLALVARDPWTTVFQHYYNSSTPTETGMLSQLCSFLPPTGHGENEVLRKHQLLCLPEVLGNHGYTSRTYITGVQKDYAGKDEMFAQMDVHEILGTEELQALIAEEPKSWGFSDHQLFPQIQNIAEEKSRSGPFVLMYSTIDSHPPFNLSKDVVPYRDGKSNVLNAFHSTDDALFTFWKNFKQSPLAQTTIVAFVADHAVFPGAGVAKLFPEDARHLSYYDATTFLLYVPDSVLPKSVDVIASGLDFAPTMLHILGINVANSFEGHSIFDGRVRYQNILGMHELGMYINQEGKNGKRKRAFSYFFDKIACPENDDPAAVDELTMCDFRQFYLWKRAMLEAGRLWKKS